MQVNDLTMLHIVCCHIDHSYVRFVFYGMYQQFIGDTYVFFTDVFVTLYYHSYNTSGQ